MEEHFESRLEQQQMSATRDEIMRSILERQGEVAQMFAQLRDHTATSTTDTRVSLPIAMAGNLHQVTIYDPRREQLSERELLALLTSQTAPRANTSLLLEAARKGLIYGSAGDEPIGIDEKDGKLFVITDKGKYAKELTTALVGDDPLHVAPETLTLLEDLHHQYQESRARSRSEVREHKKGEQEKVIETMHAIFDHLAAIAPVFQTQTARAKDRPVFKAGMYFEDYAITYEIRNIQNIDPQAYARLIELIEQLPTYDTQEPSIHSVHYARILSHPPFVELCDKLDDTYRVINQGKGTPYGSPQDIARSMTPQVIGFTRYKERGSQNPREEILVDINPSRIAQYTP